MKSKTKEPRACANEGCARAAQPGRVLCDTCELEWTLYRRDLRIEAPSPSPRS
jgi:hypothetical protein